MTAPLKGLFDLSGRTALVTGSSKGIGLAVAHWLAREGVHVGLVARSGERLEKEGAALGKATGVNVRTLAADLSDAAARERVVAAFPDVDILINNAGAIPRGSLDDVTPEAWRHGWDLKVFGYIDLTRYILPRMKARKSGVIINIIGMAGERPEPGYIANVTVFDANGNPVNYLARNALCGREGFFRWDGMDDNHNALAKGHYIILTDLFHINGTTKRFRNAIGLFR